jgi:hypothetical protein
MGNSNNHTVCSNDENLLAIDKKEIAMSYPMDDHSGDLGCFCMSNANVDRHHEMSVHGAELL